jgi:hypothetical protein
MSGDNPERSTEADADLQREIRAERKFTLAEAIGRMAGPGMMKGVSPVGPFPKRGADGRPNGYSRRGARGLARNDSPCVAASTCRPGPAAGPGPLRGFGLMLKPVLPPVKGAQTPWEVQNALCLAESHVALLLLHLG